MKMPVQCLLIREGGTKVDLGGTTYHFHPDNDPTGKGRHIAVITDKAHLARLVSITEGYELVDDEEPTPALTTPAPVVQVAAPVNPQALGTAAPGPQIEPAVSPVPLQAPVPTEPATAPGGVAMDPGPVTLQPPAPTEAPAPDPTAPTALPTESEMEGWEIEALQAQYRLEIGKEPNVNAKAPLLISRILATRAV